MSLSAVSYRRGLVALTASLLLAACESQTTLGGGSSPVTGSAGPNGSTNASPQLEKCDRPLGTMALVESQDPGTAQSLAAYGLGSPTGPLRVLMQQSNCFIVVDRGQAMQNILQERQLNQSGELRGGANFGGGQLVAADLAMSPSVSFAGDTGGTNLGALGGAFIPGIGGAIAGGLGGGLKTKQASTTLLVTDARSGLQIAAATGSAEARDYNFGLGAGGFGGGGGGAASFGKFGETPQGKVVTAAMMDAFNNVVRTVRSLPPLPSVAAAQGVPIGGVRPSATTATSAKPGSIAGKQFVANGTINLYDGPSPNAAVIGKATPGTILKATGKIQGARTEVESGTQVGWTSSSGIRPYQ